MKLWLDDLRLPPDDSWTWAKTVQDAIPVMERGDVTEASLDHDLGEGIDEGYTLCLWMAEHDIWPSEAIKIHSANPPGADRMAGVIERYSRFRRLRGTRRFERADPG